MLLLPVIDIRGGVAVRGVGGERHLYEPISSWLCDSSDPVKLATAIRRKLNARHLYVADLDAIEGSALDWKRVVNLGSQTDCLWLDVGCGDVERFLQLETIQQSCQQEWRIVVALESLYSPAVFSAIMKRASLRDRVVFSLDMRAGELLGNSSWKMLGEPIDVARFALDSGCRSMIVLDLADVGNERGTSTLDLVRKVREQNSTVEVIAGGGIRTASDLQCFAANGVQFALVASALHNRSLSHEVIEKYL